MYGNTAAKIQKSKPNALPAIFRSTKRSQIIRNSLISDELLFVSKNPSSKNFDTFINRMCGLKLSYPV